MQTAFLIALSYTLLCVAETVTLFGFQPNGYPNNAISLSAAGVGADGATTYVEEIFRTAVVYGDSQTTGTDSTAIPVQTLHATLVADASVYRYSMLPTTGLDGVEAYGVIEICTLDGNGGGQCVAQGWEDGGETATTTLTGPVAPFYTLTVDASTQSPSKNGVVRVPFPMVLAWVISGLLACFRLL
ncbi:hypothetical protein K438DRAFT_1973263 [Mycena galopus ATCC 62051]|nr:hypothetical protein K438DRAFT_1973263 [Mycena galopus ATCC 62051]